MRKEKVAEKVAKFSKRMEAYPDLVERFEAILDIAENTSGDLITADEAEERAIEEVRKLGHELLREWAINREVAAVKTATITHRNAKKHEKKSSIGNPHLDE
jgi:hypothetical protein